MRQKHIQNLSSVKPSIDNHPPATYAHLQNKRKKMQIQEGALVNGLAADPWQQISAPRFECVCLLTLLACLCCSIQLTERLKAIERENGILLSKLSRIAARKGPEGSGVERGSRALHPGEACSLGSLNGLSRKRELQRIARDNHAILKRIQERQSQKSCYDRNMMDNEWQQTLMYRRLASQHQESPGKETKKGVVLPPIESP